MARSEVLLFYSVVPYDHKMPTLQIESPPTMAKKAPLACKAAFSNIKNRMSMDEGAYVLLSVPVFVCILNGFSLDDSLRLRKLLCV